MDNHLFLTSKAFEGLEQRGLAQYPEYQERLKKELDIIESGNLADFFLNTAYICMKMKSQGILVGLGRGSAAGSLVCYCLKITEIDPIKHDLLFERFLNPTRINAISSADIDTDIPRDKRKEVLEMVKSDFGEEKTFQIINKLQWTEKTAIKDLARIIDVPFDLTNKITKLISDDESAEDVPEVVDFLNQYPFIRDNYKKLLGLPKTYGVHAGGVITLDKPVEFYDSIVKVNGVECLDNNGKTCDNMGFLKNDLLGLGTLTIIADCLKLLPNVKLPKTYDDPAVFETINESTLGIFQIEAAGASDVCYRLKPNNFEELCLVVALCRPGAMDSGDTDHYIARKHGLEPVRYDHPLLEPILKDNLGAIVYQEDAMHIVTDFAGMSATDADTIRRGIGKKIQSVFDEYKPKFLKACVDKGIEYDTAEIVWEKMEASASYSFNKSHCVSYTALSYICGWLKTYFPIEFFLAILNNTKDEDKRMKIYNEIRNINSEIVNPDINISKDITTTNYDGKVYLSLNLIKGIGPSAIENILESQPYSSFDDFCDRCKVNKSVKTALIEAGAFDRFGVDRCTLYNKLHDLPQTKWINLSNGTKQEQIIPEEDWSEKEILFKEFQRIKINPNGNILELFDLNEMNINKKITSIADALDNQEDYKDFYIKVLSSDLKLKEDYAYASVTDGFDNISLFLTKEFIPRYVDDLNEIGVPLLCHIHGKGSKYTLLSLINLQDPEKRQHEYWHYVGEDREKLKILQKQNPDINVGIISNIRYFTSKNGNRCAWYNVYVDDETILEDRIVCNSPPNMVDGSFLFFFVQENPVFLQIVEVS